MIEIVGTSHIAQESIQKIQNTFQTFQPDFVALELDPGRLHALLHPHQKTSHFEIIRAVGIKGYLSAQLGRFVQNKLGKAIGMKPGVDMLTALRLAQEKKIPFILIDQNIQITLQRISQQLTWKEKFQFIKDIFHPPKEYQSLKKDLRSLPSSELIREILIHLKKYYPNLYRVLVHERNQHMIRELRHFEHHHPDKKILVIIGAGHEEAMRYVLIPPSQPSPQKII